MAQHELTEYEISLQLQLADMKEELRKKDELLRLPPLLWRDLPPERPCPRCAGPLLK